MNSLSVYSHLAIIVNLGIFAHAFFEEDILQISEIRNNFDKICYDAEVKANHVCHETVGHFKTRAKQGCLPARSDLCKKVRGLPKSDNYRSAGSCERAVEQLVCSSIDTVGQLTESSCTYVLNEHFINSNDRQTAIEKACSGAMKSTSSAVSHVCYRMVDHMCERLHSLTKEIFQACKDVLDKKICEDDPENSNRGDGSIWDKYFVYYPGKLSGSVGQP